MLWKNRKEISEEEITQLREAGFTNLIARILASRDIDKETAEALFNSPENLIYPSEELQNIRRAAEKILEYTDNSKSEIWIYADYDVDGLTSGYILMDYLRSISQNGVYVYYPDRDEGYGLNKNFCEIMADRLNAQDIDKILVVTVDNGVSCNSEIELLATVGIETVVLDHHLPGDVLPECIIVNPHVDSESKQTHLAGCGVVYKLIRFIDEEVAKKYYFAVALGTVADVMPGHIENMALIKLGLDQLNSGECPKAFNIIRKKVLEEEYNVRSIAWTVGPLLNACGRMGEIDKAAELFISDQYTDQEVTDMVLEIEELNQERKDYTKKAKKDIQKIDYSKNYACFFDASKYHSGISGPLASSIVDQWNKPSFVYTIEDDIASGSVRTASNIDVEALLGEQMRKGILISYGGHAQAGGFVLEAERIEELQESIEEYISSIDLPKEKEELIIDTEATLKELSKKNYKLLTQIYFDILPIIAIKSLNVSNVRVSKSNNENICLSLSDKDSNADIWAWRMGDMYKEIESPTLIDIAGTIDKVFRGNGATLNIVDLRKSKKKLLSA